MPYPQYLGMAAIPPSPSSGGDTGGSVSTSGGGSFAPAPAPAPAPSAPAGTPTAPGPTGSPSPSGGTALLPGPIHTETTSMLDFSQQTQVSQPKAGGPSTLAYSLVPVAPDQAVPVINQPPAVEKAGFASYLTDWRLWAAGAVIYLLFGRRS